MRKTAQALLHNILLVAVGTALCLHSAQGIAYLDSSGKASYVQAYQERSAFKSHLLNGEAELPCNVSTHFQNDSLNLAVWYKWDVSKDIGVPIVSYDIRKEGLSRKPGAVWTRDEYKDRAVFEISSGLAVLKLGRITTKDAGDYKCRADFKATPTRNSLVRLDIIEPPQPPEIKDDYHTTLSEFTRPYKIGDNMSLTCYVRGGQPPPNIIWYRNDVLVERTDSSIVMANNGVRTAHLIVYNLTREHLHTVYTCAASNNNQSQPPSTKVRVEMLLPPIHVHISGPVPKEGGIPEKKPFTFECKATGSRPPATITWWKGKSRIPNSDITNTILHDENIAISTSTFVPTKQDFNVSLVCEAENRNLSSSPLRADLKLNVEYQPTVTIELGSGLNISDIKEGDSLYFTCKVDANPAPYKTVWKWNGLMMKESPTTVYNNNLVLTKVNRSRSGNYSCEAYNVAGDGVSNVMNLKVKYKPVCLTDRKTTVAVALNEQAEIPCRVSAHPPATEFVWKMNSSGGVSDLPDSFFARQDDPQLSTLDSHSPIELNEASNLMQYDHKKRRPYGFAHNIFPENLTFTLTNEQEYGIYMCSATNVIGKQEHPCFFTVVPAGKPDPPSNCSILNQTATALEVECIAGYNGGQTQTFFLEVFDSISGNKLLANVSSSRFGAPAFLVSGLKPGLVLDMRVYAANSKGRSEVVHVEAFTLKGAEKITAPELSLAPVLGALSGLAAVVILGAAVVLGALRVRGRSGPRSSTGLGVDGHLGGGGLGTNSIGGRGGGGASPRPLRPVALPLKDKDKSTIPLRSEMDDLGDKDDRNPDLIPCNKDSDYQLATPGLNNQSPADAHQPSRILRNGDLFSSYKDNRENERERYISRLPSDDVDYAELCHSRHEQRNGGTGSPLSPDSATKIRRVVQNHEPVVYAQIDYSRKGLCSSPLSAVSVSSIQNPSISHGFREIVTVRTPLMANQQESCV